MLRLLWILLILLTSSCSREEEFAPPGQEETFPSRPILAYSTEFCSQSTQIRPKVDFLFVWDNSTSTFFINSQTKQALQSTITLMSDRFDYRILLAPLIDSNTQNPTEFLQ
jgi:hypothetical protein